MSRTPPPPDRGPRPIRRGHWLSFRCPLELPATASRLPQAASGYVQRIYIASDPPVDAKRAKGGSKQLPETTVGCTRHHTRTHVQDSTAGYTCS